MSIGNVYRVLNLGAGVQSTALYLMASLGWYDFDVAIFADTGEEPQDVYKHLAWLRSINTPPIWVRSAGKLGDNLMKGRNLDGGRFVSIPCFTAPDHLARPDGFRNGILRRQCTREYKIDVVVKAIRRELVGLEYRQHMPKDVKVYQYFGITTDEIERTKRTLAQKWSVPVYPFVEMGWSRQDCIKWLETRVPHTVPRSACTFCPYHSNKEWQRLKQDDADGWQRAVEIDNALREPGNVCNRNMEKKMYLHRSCRPLELVDFESAIDLKKPMANECQGMCGV